MPNLCFKDCEKIQWAMEQNNINVIILNKDELVWNVIKAKLPEWPKGAVL